MRYNDLGAALAYQGKWDEAIEQWQIALQWDPLFEAARDNLERAKANRFNQRGIEQGKLGNYEEAIKLFRRALELVPNHEEALENLEQALRLLSKQGSKTSSDVLTPATAPDRP